MGSLFDITPTPTSLSEVRKQWKDCKTCFFAKDQEHSPCLIENKKGTEVYVIGQWPGQEDMKDGIPFSGKQGIVCKDMLHAAGFEESILFYDNALMCTCPMTPTKDILTNCSAHTDQALSIVKPKLIIALGAVAAERLKVKEGVTSYKGIEVVTCLHPAAIARARSQQDKEAVRAQVQEQLRHAFKRYSKN